jgi:hypothetical protein
MMRCAMKRFLFALTAAVACFLFWGAHCWAEGDVSGNVTTSCDETDTPLTTSIIKTYADQVGGTGKGNSYLSQYRQRYRAPQTLSGATYEIVVKQTDGTSVKIGEGKTDVNGKYSVTVPDQYKGQLATGNISLVFYADTDSAAVTKPVWVIGAASLTQYAKSGEIPLGPNGGDLNIKRSDTPYTNEFTATNNLLKTVDSLKAKVETAKSYMPGDVQSTTNLGKADVFYPGDQKPGLSIGNLVFSGETLMGYNATNGKKWIEVKGGDATNILDEEKFDFFGHEYGHYVFSNLVGSDYSSYCANVQNHDLGAITGNERLATNESFAYFFAGLDQDLPQSLYKKNYMEQAKSEYMWNYRSSRPGLWGSDPENAQKMAKNLIKKQLDELENKVNQYESLPPAEMNTVEGYFTEFLNEIYFGGYYPKDEALGKIMGVIAKKKPKNVDDFIAGWIDLYGSSNIDTIRQKVSNRVFSEIRNYIQAKRDWLASLGENTPYTPPPASYIPGGMAVSPVDRHEIYVTDNTNGRLLMLIPGDFKSVRQITLMKGLNHPGDVDMAENGRALVVAEADKVRKLFFGLTATITDSSGAPLPGADVVINGEFPAVATKTDVSGVLSVMNLINPGMGDYLIYLTVSSLGKTQVFPIYLNYTGQKVIDLVFTAN